MSDPVTHYVAVHKLTVSDPDFEMIATGGWNPDGTPIMRKASKQIAAGSFFPVSLLEGGDEEVRRLIGLGAIRLPEANELALFERNQAEG